MCIIAIRLFVLIIVRVFVGKTLCARMCALLINVVENEFLFLFLSERLKCTLHAAF